MNTQDLTEKHANTIKEHLIINKYQQVKIISLRNNLDHDQKSRRQKSAPLFYEFAVTSQISIKKIMSIQ